MRKFGIAVAALAALALSACSASNSQQPTAAIQTVQQDAATVLQFAQGAVNAYPIAKGLVQIAAVADPALAPTISAGIAKLDPIVAQASTMIAAGSSDLALLTSLATAINQQVQALTITAAPAIKVVPSGT